MYHTAKQALLLNLQDWRRSSSERRLL